MRNSIIAIGIAATLLAGTVLLSSAHAGPTSPRYFAQIDKNGIVQRVIVADQSFINSGLVGDPSMWRETSMDGSIGGKYAGRGYIYSTTTSAFYGSQTDLDISTGKIIVQPAALSATST